MEVFLLQNEFAQREIKITIENITMCGKKLCIRAFIAFLAACFLTACVAETLIVDPDYYLNQHGLQYNTTSGAAHITISIHIEKDLLLIPLQKLVEPEAEQSQSLVV